MKNEIKYIFTFVAGAVIGSAATWKFVKDKYERIANEEIESVKEVFSKRLTEPILDTSEEEKAPEKPEEKVNIATKIPAVFEYDNILKKEGYTDYSVPAQAISKIEKGGAIVIDRPYVIEPDEFAELSDYETCSLTYYADGVLTDDYDEVLSDETIEDIVGKDAVNHFGEYEDDSVFVRNDALKTDYEILYDSRRYSDVFGSPAGK